MPDITIMFFLLGLFAGLVRSDLSIPKAFYDALSLLLMLTIGLKGGLSLHQNIDLNLVIELICVISLGTIIPLLLFPLIRKTIGLSLADSVSIAVHYGSVSAGTFAVALAYVELHNLEIVPHITLYLVSMEVPAIIVGLLLYRKFKTNSSSSEMGGVWHEAFTNRGIVLLVGGLLIGWMYGPTNGAQVTGLLIGGFKSILSIFLLAMGLSAANSLRPFPFKQWRLLSFAILAPPILAIIGIFVGKLLGLNEGTLVVLASLTASASYIAAPVAIKNSIPEADIGLAMFAALGITFPFNVIIGIGLYHKIISLIGA